IEAATMAWHPLGWEPAFFSEIENFPSAVLAHHYPHVPNLGDMTKFQEWPDHAIDLLVGGTPCQSFSVAGLRAGLADPRGNLMLTYLAIAARYRPRWLVWENVPGVLSSNGGRDFGTFLGGLGELGYGFAYRVLDAQFCRTHGHDRAVPQRRRRVFVIGYLGDWRRATAVLFDGASLRGDPAPSRSSRKDVAPTISSRPTGGGGLGTDFDLDGGLIAADIAATLPAGGNATGGARQPGMGAETAATMLIAFAQNQRDEVREVPVAGALAAEPGMKQQTYLAHAIQAGALRENVTSGPDGVGVQADLAYTVEARAEVQAVAWSIMPQNSGKDYKARAVEVAQPIMAGGPVGGNQGGD
ncbi:MAG: DNA cytosine methyltransferase, partial [Alphaproteobacteria bacterium]